MTEPDLRERFTINLKCPQCDQTGWIIWQDRGGTDRPRASEKHFVDAFGFHPESGRTSSGDPVIVCDACDEIQVG